MKEKKERPKKVDAVRRIEIEKSWQEDGFLFVQCIHHKMRIVLSCSFATPEAKEELRTALLGSA